MFMQCITVKYHTIEYNITIKFKTMKTVNIQLKIFKFYSHL